MAETKWGVGVWLPFKRRKEWDSLVVSKKSCQLEKSTVVFCHLQCQYCRWNISRTTSASASLQPPLQGHVQSPGLQQRRNLAALHKPQYPKVAYAWCYKWCVHHIHEDFMIFLYFLKITSDFLGQELLRYITVYHMYITWETMFNHANKMFTNSLLQQSPGAPCYSNSSKCTTLLTTLMCFCSYTST